MGEIERKTCGAVSPTGTGITCYRQHGHVGPHRGSTVATFGVASRLNQRGLDSIIDRTETWAVDAAPSGG